MIYTDSERSSDFKWFIDHYNDLWKTYGHKIFVIQNKDILGIYPDKNIAIDETIKNHELGTFIVQECNGHESGYTNYITSWELL